jgi:hypothetical protein
MRRLLALALLALLVSVLDGCAGPPPRRDPGGEVFPAVTGRALDGETVALPADLAGGPAVLLVGYVMKAQFDVDRWILGLVQAGTPARVVEVPTITGMVPGLFAGTIDEGMRGGIPAEDWGSVVTLYGADAKRVKALTGEGGRNTRVLLLDAAGTIVWFHDRDYSAGVLLELDRKVRELAPAGR